MRLSHLSSTDRGAAAAPGRVTEFGEKEAELYAPREELRCESGSVFLLDAVSQSVCVESHRFQLESNELALKNWKTDVVRLRKKSDYFVLELFHGEAKRKSTTIRTWT